MANDARRALAALCGHLWAIMPPALEQMLAIAGRESDAPALLKALEARSGKPLENTQRGTVRDGVAILPVQGPLFKRANLFSEISGATSYEILMKDLRAAIDDASVRSVLLNVDSPGGDANGMDELAQAIRAASEEKPVWAYVGGLGASAAYGISVGASRVVAARSAELGSIGVVAVFERDDREGRYEVVSSQSPLKRPDPETEAGAAALQRRVDALAAVFIDQVAAHRGVSAAVVQSQFGAGGVLIAAEALAAGMVDALGTFEETLAELSAQTKGARMSEETAAAESAPVDPAAAAAPTPPPLTADGVAQAHPSIAEHFRAEGAAAERARILAIDDATPPGYEGEAAKAKADPNVTAADFALAVLTAEQAHRAQASQALAQAEDEMDPPAATTGAGDAGQAADPSMAELGALDEQRLKALMNGR